MACFESGTVISLSAREAVTLPDVRGATLRVTRGTLWLTEERSRHDVVLRAGDNWVVESEGNTVVEAQNDAVFCIVGHVTASIALPAPRPQPAHGPLSALATRFATWFATPPRLDAPRP